MAQQELDSLPVGYRFAGATGGIKASGSKDVALITSDEPCVGVGVYTQNVVRASSIEWNEAITPSPSIRAVVVNSGNANACTGELGTKNTAEMAQAVAQEIGGQDSQVLVLSTGVIGIQLPMQQVRSGIANAASNLGNTAEHFLAAVDGIRTTDRDRKWAERQLKIGDDSFQISGMAKGAGMIGPRMATMLSVLVTDAPLNQNQAQTCLKNAVDRSFNRISVEGHTSTNDAVILLCQNSVGRQMSAEGLQKFEEELSDLCIELAKKIPADGEGATHLIQIDVTGTADDQVADQVARVVASSNLVKTAITGADPNWGRIVSAVGILNIELDPSEIGLSINGHCVFEKGQPLPFETAAVSQSISEHFETHLSLTLGNGPGSAVHWSSDLTVDYVKFNSEYTT